MPIAPATALPAILVVDDDPGIREALTLALADRYVVHTAVCGAEAVAILRAHPIALIVLDVVLHDEHGLDLIAPFRRVSPARILVLTGQGSEAVAAQALWAKADGYLPKPLTLPTLRAAVERLVAPAAPPPDLATRARQRLETDPAKPFHAEGFARELGVSEPHLRWIFRQAHGKTPHQYLRDVRLARAATLLRTSHLGVEGIASEVGYPDVTWFSKLFKRAFGVTPAAFRAGERPTEECARGSNA
jgi:YesN/AraC family two-component response regulator